MFPKNASAVITRILMDLSPDGTPAFLATSEFWEALELAAKIVDVFDHRPHRRDRIVRDLLRKTRPVVAAEFYRILGRLPAVVEKLRSRNVQVAEAAVKPGVL